MNNKDDRKNEQDSNVEGQQNLTESRENNKEQGGQNARDEQQD